jgi:hypothetical protein
MLLLCPPPSKLVLRYLCKISFIYFVGLLYFSAPFLQNLFESCFWYNTFDFHRLHKPYRLICDYPLQTFFVLKYTDFQSLALIKSIVTTMFNDFNSSYSCLLNFDAELNWLVLFSSNISYECLYYYDINYVVSNYEYSFIYVKSDSLNP